MSKITDALTTKIGPLPAWVYGLSLGVGINAVRWYRNRNAPAAEPVSDGTDDAAGATPDTPTGYDSGLGFVSAPGTVGGYTMPTSYQANPGGVIVDSNGGTTAPTVASGPLNNGDWQRRSFDVLVAEGYAPTSVQTALTKYLTGEPVTAAEEAMVSMALRRVGSPPEGAPSLTRATGSTSGAPATAPTSPAPPIEAPFVRPAWLGSARFVKGSGPAIYLVTDQGLEWVPSEEAFKALGGSFGRQGEPPVNYLTVPDSALRNLKRIGTLPPREADPSLP